MVDLLADVSYSLRRLSSAPMLTCALVLTLAFGIGANAAVFSIVNGVLLKARPEAADARVVAITMSEHGRLYPERTLKREYLEHLRVRPPTQLERISGVRQFRTVARFPGEDRAVIGEAIFGDYFALVGARPVIGHFFSVNAADDERVVVINERLWRSAFSSAPDIVGQTLVLGDEPYTIVGVVTSSFRGLVLGNLIPYDVWVPRANAPGLSRDDHTLAYLIGRLKSGVSLKAARAEMNVIGADMDPSHPEIGVGIEPLADALFSGPPVFFVAAAVLLLVSGLVFLIAVTNLTNLLLTGVLNRWHELAVRRMLGADHGHLVRLLAVETASLVLTGLALSLPITAFLGTALSHLPLPERGGIVPVLDASPDWRVFCFAFVTAFVVAMAVTTVLSRQASNVEALTTASAMAGGGGSTDGRGRVGSRLMAIQVACAVALLVNAAIVIHTTTVVLRWDPGVDTSDTILGRVDYRLDPHVQNGAPVHALLESLASAPGVVHAAAATSVPGSRHFFAGLLSLPNQSSQHSLRSQIVAASPTFVKTLGLRLLAGRNLLESDARSSAAVALLNERAINALDIGTVPLGKFVRITDGAGVVKVAQVVGVVSDVLGYMSETPMPVAIMPLGAERPAELVIALRGTAPEERLRRTLREAIQTFMPTPAPLELTTLKQELLGDTYSLSVSLTALCCLGMLGGSIALLGVYSMTSYRISRRVREFGIRAALGATRGQIYALVFGESRSVLTAGIIAGMFAATPIAFMLRSIVPRLRIVDPLTVVTVPLLFLSAGFLATALPLRKILNRDPSLALREL